MFSADVQILKLYLGEICFTCCCFREVPYSGVIYA